MAVVVINMIASLLNANHSPEDALKLVTQFLSMVVQRKLKLDPELIDEIISTVIHNFLKFVDQLAMEDMTRIFSITNNLQDVPSIHVPKLSDDNRAKALIRFFGERAIAWEKAHK